MPERLAFYFRGPTTGIELPSTFVSDAKVLLDLPLDALRRIADDLTQYPGFLSDGMLDKIVAAALADEPSEKASQLARVIRFGEYFFRGNKNGYDSLISRLERWYHNEKKQEQELIDEKELHQIRERLHVVLKEYPGRIRQAKADRLAEATGLRAESIDLICDLRPVLDENRSNIIGFIPLTTLRIVASGVDQFPITFETLLSAKDVQTLYQVAETAVKKLNALGDFAAQHDIKIPAIELTETTEISREDDA